MNKLLPHQERVVAEKSELDEKLVKLTVFIDGDLFESLPNDEHLRLIRQMKIMAEYSLVLGERIGAFTNE